MRFYASFEKVLVDLFGVSVFATCNTIHNSCYSILVIWVKPRENFMPFHGFQEWSAQLIARTFELYAQTKTML